ncbi:hypothetical protein SAMN05192574_101163 [Mucilaginibacter gossypiicola]|uniref:Uncharacterized protein n=1 Tax=Mucilaginibacter gossypiicola TaxID=551995 RepID=A0A1H7ZRU1_9SPHI|nr:hypothetical protein [Mucilaginibacter gossypiicola]SEM61003.1 hypothetical protein SAMN05192574_101163 [Mucilaginibacter gossypiicola]
MNTNNENWENRDNERDDFENNTNSFSINGVEARANRDLESDDDDLDEINDIADDDRPEVEKTEKERVGTHSQSEVDQPNRSADTSFSEQTDVTPPNKKEFPSVGPAKTDFESRPHGRTTGRMLGHEPGTEGI